MDVREICVRRREKRLDAGAHLFVGFVCCHIFYIEYLCYRNSRTPAAQCTMGRRKLVDSKALVSLEIYLNYKLTMQCQLVDLQGMSPPPQMLTHNHMLRMGTRLGLM